MKAKLKDLRDNHSFALLSPVLVKAPGHRKRYISPKDYNLANHERTYSISHDVLAFIHDGCLFVTPYTKNKEFILLGENFVKGTIIVPFTAEVPCVEPDCSKWQKLCEE